MKKFFVKIKEAFLFLFTGKIPNSIKESIDKITKQAIEEFRVEQNKKFEEDLAAYQNQISNNIELTDKILKAPLITDLDKTNPLFIKKDLSQDFKEEAKEAFEKVKERFINNNTSSIENNIIKGSTHIVNKETLNEFKELVDPGFIPPKEPALIKEKIKPIIKKTSKVDKVVRERVKQIKKIKDQKSKPQGVKDKKLNSVNKKTKK